MYKKTMNAKNIVNDATPFVNLLDAISNDGQTAARLTDADAADAMTAVCIGRMNAAEYVTALFASNAARKLDAVDAPADAVPVVIAVEYADDAENDDDMTADYIRAVMPARDTLDAVSIAHTYAAALADMDGTPAEKTRVTYDITAAPALIMDAARLVAKSTAKNAVMREGTPTQERIYAAARARRWNEQDLDDMAQAAAEMLVSVLYESPATLARRAAILARLAKYYRDIPADDIRARLAAENAARRAARDDDMTARAICGDYSKVAARARLWTLAADAARALADDATPAAIFAARHAAFRAVNNYLTDARAIRTNDAPPALSLDEIGDDYAAALAAAHDEKTAAALAARHDAVATAFDLMPAPAAKVARFAARGYGVMQTARALRRGKTTIAEHRAAAADYIRAALADAFTADADAARLASVTDIIADTAADAMTAARAAKAARDAKAARARIPAALMDAAAKNPAALMDAINTARDIMTPPAVAVFAAYMDGMTERAAAAHLGKSKTAVHAAALAAARIIIDALYSAADIHDAPPVLSLAAVVAFVKTL